MNGIFIVFEGIDGAGKGEQMKRLAAFLFEKSKRYDEIVLTRNPTYKQYGQELRKRLAEEKDTHENAKEIAELFVKDRTQNAEEVIKPALSRGAVVLCDRYMMSTLAFQTTAGLELNELLEMQKNLPRPTMTLVFDLSPEEAMKRLDGGKEKFEKHDFLKQVRKNYLHLAQTLSDQKCAIIDASGTREEVFQRVLEALEERKVLPY